MMNPLVSIIIPIYNASKYLEKCIDSVLNQSYENYQLILVNDGSSDDSSIICHKYSNRHPNITTIDKPNGGVSSARNCGLDEAKGRYVTFLDSDDFLEPDFLYSCVNNIGHSDLYICGAFMEWYQGEDIVKVEPCNIIQGSHSVKSFLEAMNIDYPLLCIGTPWGKLFDLNIIRKNHIRFDENSSVSEDTLFCAEYLDLCEKIELSNSNLYHYRRINADALWSKYHINIYEAQCKAYDMLRNVFYHNNCSEDSISKYNALYFDLLVGAIQSAYQKKIKDKRIKYDLMKKVAENKYVLQVINSDCLDGTKRKLVAYTLKGQRFRLLDFILTLYYSIYC